MIAAGLLLAAALAPARATPASPEDTLYSELARQVRIAEPNEAKAAYLRETLAAMLESPSARAAATELVSQKIPTIDLRWAHLEYTVLKYDASRSVAEGFTGKTVHGSTWAVVSLNDELRQANSPRESAGALAHELLGHALEGLLADRAGLGYGYALSHDNETSASLLGDLVSAELGLPPLEPVYLSPPREPRLPPYLSDPQGYFAERIYGGPGYAVALTRAEMADVRRAFQARLGLIDRRRQEWVAIGEEASNQVRWIDHFIELHGWSPRPFALLRSELESQRDQKAPWRVRLCDEISDTLRGLVDSLESAPQDGKKLAAAARHPLMRRWERQVSDRTKRLRERSVALRVPRDPPQPRPEGALDQQELERMITADIILHSEPPQKPARN